MSIGAGPDSFSVRRSKITEYLLNVHHPVGSAKAKFFLGFGFSLDDVSGMGAALTEHASFNGPGIEKIDARGLPTIVIEGPIATPDRRNPKIRTVWLLNSPSEAEFVTAYPCR